MFVHINPEANAIGETISTLKFAERVASIELGAARANKETTEIRNLKAEVCSCFTSFTNSCMRRSHRETCLILGLNNPIIKIFSLWASRFEVISPWNGLIQNRLYIFCCIFFPSLKHEVWACGVITYLLLQISNLKSTLEKKEAELENLKCVNVRTNAETQKPRPVSPMHVPRLARTPVEDKTSEVL